jgi:hypothetical protein
MSGIGEKMTVNDRQQQAYQFYIKKGWTPHQAAAIVGNLTHESGLNPIAEGDIGYKGGSSRGLAQFRGERLQKLKTKYGSKWTDFNNQLDFVNWELNNTHKSAGNALRNTNNIYDAGRVVSDDYEIPAKKFKADTGRQKKVFDAYSKLAGAAMFTKQAKSGQTPSMENYIPSPYASKLINYGDVNYGSINIRREEDTPQEIEAKQKIDKATTEQQIIEEYFAKNQQGLAQSEPQQEVQVQQGYEAPSIVEQYAQVSNIVDNPVAQEGGKVPISSKGVYDFPMQEVIVPTNNGRITMSQVNYPILGIDEYGNQQMMYPNQEYKFPGKTIHEIPQLKNYFNKR